MSQEVFDFHKIFSKESLEDNVKTAHIKEFIENHHFDGFFTGCNAPVPTGIVLNYNVDEVNEQIGIASGLIGDPEKEFRRSGFNAIQRKE